MRETSRRTDGCSTQLLRQLSCTIVRILLSMVIMTVHVLYRFVSSRCTIINCRDNCLVQSSEYCSPWSSWQWYRFVSSRCTIKPWQLLGLAHFRISASDTRLRDHLQRAARNDTHPQIPRISILGGHIHNTIWRKVGSNVCYTMIAGEVTDNSNKEQLSIVLRCVENKTSFVRALLSCIHTELLTHWVGQLWLHSNTWVCTIS